MNQERNREAPSLAAGHSDFRKTGIYFNRKEEDGQLAAKKTRNRLVSRKNG